jgi:hypothetical protein
VHKGPRKRKTNTIESTCSPSRSRRSRRTTATAPPPGSKPLGVAGEERMHGQSKPWERVPYTHEVRTGDRVTEHWRDAPWMRARHQSNNRSSNNLHHGASGHRGRRRKAPKVRAPKSRRGRCRGLAAPPPPHHHGRPGRGDHRSLHSVPSSLAASVGRARRQRATALAGDRS